MHFDSGRLRGNSNEYRIQYGFRTEEKSFVRMHSDRRLCSLINNLRHEGTVEKFDTKAQRY